MSNKCCKQKFVIGGLAKTLTLIITDWVKNAQNMREGIYVLPLFVI